ncbi:RICIN domain-containing protein [Cellulomonas sp. NS3]|uniref:RICIN domain-containing protein n=1 Tax=Cellulomonas sp. NS3 TaxID=2973977 RepID=UPI002163BA1A|nr:RICIN domain-containing protein [Cellulomonas sp. NS3]
MPTTTTRRHRGLSRLRDDSGVAMMTTVMMMLIMTALSVLVLGLVVNQVAPTQFAQKNTRTIFAAEAGVEAALGRIRTAVGTPDFTGAVYGNPQKLPCTLSGAVDAAGSATSYTATVRYFTEDPSGRDDAWLATNAMSCSPSNGTGSVLPSYAMISSAGDAATEGKISATSGDRAISMVYRFETTTTNIAGGRIYAWNGTSTPVLCLRASSTSAGASVAYRAASTCGTTANEDLELWVYDTDYTIKLASSTLTATPLCLTNESGSIVLRSCGTPTFTQLWSWDKDGRATWVAQDSAINDTGSCLYSGRTSGNPVAGDTLKVGSCASQAAWGSFAPDPAVGPGAASANTRQIVNYLEFGRCFDVTDTEVTRPFMISYPCKQDPPAAASLFWNHKWFYEEPLVGTTRGPQQIYVLRNNDSAQKYCLRTAGGVTDPAYSGVDAGFYVTLTSACNTVDTTQQWTRSTATGNKTTSWTIRDSSGRCVGVGGSRYNGNWSTLVVSTCDGSTAQKWNAPADSVEAEIGNYLEETS